MSWCSLLIPFSLAIFSADWPIDSPVEGSAIAGATGTRSLGLIPATSLIRWERVFALLSPTSISLKRFEWRMGTLERLSAPPAMTTRAYPCAIWSAP